MNSPTDTSVSKSEMRDKYSAKTHKACKLCESDGQEFANHCLGSNCIRIKVYDAAVRQLEDPSPFLSRPRPALTESTTPVGSRGNTTQYHLAQAHRARKTQQNFQETLHGPSRIHSILHVLKSIFSDFSSLLHTNSPESSPIRDVFSDVDLTTDGYAGLLILIMLTRPVVSDIPTEHTDQHHALSKEVIVKLEKVARFGYLFAKHHFSKALKEKDALEIPAWPSTRGFEFSVEYKTWARKCLYQIELSDEIGKKRKALEGVPDIDPQSDLIKRVIRIMENGLDEPDPAKNWPDEYFLNSLQLMYTEFEARKGQHIDGMISSVRKLLMTMMRVPSSFRV